MTNITIQNMTDADVAEIHQLGMSTPELQIDGEEPHYYPEHALRSFITSPNDIYLTAKSGETLAGYFLVLYNPYFQEAYLADMVVKPEFRSQGVASLFFAETLKRLKEKGCRWAWSLVHEDNQKMMSIFEKKGFERGRKFQMFYKIGMNQPS